MIHAGYKSFDDEFIKLSSRAVVVNNIPIEKDEDQQRLKSLLMTTYEDDKVSLLPRCDCGHLNKEWFRGDICDHCGSKVISPFEDLDPIIWFKSVDGYKFIIPSVWSQVSRVLNKSSCILRWVSDPKYNVVKTIKGQKTVEIIKSIPNFKRSYKWLIDNFDIMLDFINIHFKNPELEEIINRINKNRDRVFVNYLPVLNRHMFITERVGSLQYTRQDTMDIFDTALEFIKNTKHNSPHIIDRTMGKTCYRFAENYDKLLYDYARGKKGLPRKLIDGFRSYFTVRGVITPITRHHRLDELELPWGQAVALFRPHIINFLSRKGYSRIEISRKINTAVTVYDKEIDEIFDTLISLAKGKGKLGIPVSFNRNPSLLNGSLMLLFISVIKKDPTDISIGFSGLATKLPNADYDGDEMNLQLLIDEWLYKRYLKLKPSTSVADMSKPGEISGRVTLTDPVIATMASFISNQHNRAKKRR